jgi:hypothetical protein
MTYDDLAAAYEKVWQTVLDASARPVRYLERKYMQFVVDMARLGVKLRDYVNSHKTHVPVVIMTDPAGIRHVTGVPCAYRVYRDRRFLVFPT